MNSAPSDWLRSTIVVPLVALDHVSFMYYEIKHTITTNIVVLDKLWHWGRSATSISFAASYSAISLLNRALRDIPEMCIAAQAC